MSVRPILAVVPGRGGSKGIPRKNLRPLCGLPLIAHSIECARRIPAVERVVVSTDDREIAEVATRHGAEVPFLRPPELASDEAAMWPVIQHVLRKVEELEGRRYGSVLLLEPTSPVRNPADAEELIQIVEADPTCDGAVTVSEPRFNPNWVCVVEESGLMRDLIPGGSSFGRRQEVPRALRINGVFYLWRRDLVLRAERWRDGRIRMKEIPERTAIDIDDLDDFEMTQYLIASGRVRVPWITEEACARFKS